MSYLGGLNKSQFAAFLAEELKPFIQEIKELKSQISKLNNQLNHLEKEFYTIDEVATLFSISKATVHNWVKEKKLVKIKVGGRTQFKTSDIEKLINYSKS
jgi:excisionase family DNA binding protein